MSKFLEATQGMTAGPWRADEKNFNSEDHEGKFASIRSDDWHVAEVWGDWGESSTFAANAVALCAAAHVRDDYRLLSQAKATLEALRSVVTFGQLRSIEMSFSALDSDIDGITQHLAKLDAIPEKAGA